METCVVLAQQRTQCGYKYGGSSSSRRKSHAPGCGSNPISYHSGAGLLPTPSSTTQFQPCSRFNCSSDTQHLFVTTPKTTTIPICTTTGGLSFHELSYSELWAGPTYSNSPPPSSVPIPKFSARSTPTRTVSLELPVIAKEVVCVHSLAKSAPSSPKKSRVSAKHLFGTDDSNATKALRRILNLDVCDE